MAGPATLAVVVSAPRAGTCPQALAEDRLDAPLTLERFLAGVERRAFRHAQAALRDRDEALDVVQGAMIRLARSYGSRPGEEWPRLFHRILVNGIRDAQRRRTVRSRLFAFLPQRRDDDRDDETDLVERIPDGGPDPERRLMADQAMQRLEDALAGLPARQQEAFLLRCLQGMDVGEAADAMGCSEGSVKTHYFRALQALRAKLGEVW
jgi:RNA polymerase sigma-70 factor (ECF subfamily)